MAGFSYQQVHGGQLGISRHVVESGVLVLALDEICVVICYVAHAGWNYFAQIISYTAICQLDVHFNTGEMSRASHMRTRQVSLHAASEHDSGKDGLAACSNTHRIVGTWCLDDLTSLTNQTMRGRWL